MNLRDAPQEPRPAWAMLHPSQPYLGEILRGVRYVGLEPLILRVVLEREGCQVLAAFAAMGPRLFWGRDDGPWIPWDLEAKDQNEDRKVRERDWPWCWGDHLWIAACWDTQPLYLGFGPESCELLLGSPHPLGTNMPFAAFVEEVRAEARRVAGPHASQIQAHRFV